MKTTAAAMTDVTRDRPLTVVGKGTRQVRYLLALALAIPALACAAVGDHAVPSTGSGGRSGAGGSGAGECQVVIQPVAPSAFAGLSPGPTASLRVAGAISGVPSADATWEWAVTFADGSSVPFTHPNNSEDLIQLPLADPGSYTIAVILSGPRPCRGEKTVIVQAAGARTASFRFHFVPPPDTVPPQDQEIQVFGATPTGGNQIPLSRGTVVGFDARDPTSMAPVASYVRVSDGDGRTIEEDRTTASSGPLTLRLASGLYSLLVIPDGDADIAPALIARKSPTELAGAMPVTLDRGVMIAGTVSDDAGPIAGARVVLRAGTLPSTLGTSGSDGRFTLRAGAGVYGATITHASGDGVLEASVPASAGLIAIDGAPTPPAPTPAPTLDVHIARPATSQLTLPLSASDAASLADGARVVVESAAPLMNVATVTFGAGHVSAASVRFRSERAPAIDSVTGRASVSLAGLPPAHYRATVFPASAATADAVTVAADIDLSTSRAVTWPIQLESKVTLAGRLVPVSQAAGIRVTAVDIAGDVPAAVGGDAQTGGTFSLPVSRGRTYSLRATPASGPSQLLARAIFAPVTVGVDGAMLEDHPMPRALLFSGRVLDDTLQPLATTLVQIFCIAGATGCIDSQTSLAEAVTRGDGIFQVMLPDPGVGPSP